MRWLVPLSAAAVLVGGGAAVGVFTASAEPSLPPRSAAQLLVDLQTARLGGLSGTVVQRADLGLPALPGLGAQATENLSALVAGSNTVRVWYAGPEQVRVAVLGTLGETDVIRNGSDVWVWNSRTNEAQHRVLVNRAEPGGHLAGPAELALTPQQAADRALAAIDPSTEVSVGRSATIAGREAYELVLDPRDATSLIGQVRIAIDAAEHVPLRFEVFASGADEAAFEVAFTQVDFARPDPEQFVFNPPAGTTVTEQEPLDGAGKPDADKPGARESGAGKAEAAGWTTAGTGWTTVLVAPTGQGDDPAKAGDAAAPADREPALTALLEQLPAVSGDWGSGRLLTSNLFSALLTDDARLLVGAVTPQRLYEVAAAR
jgi:outer membrane lipoprotein-sorting protein